MLHGPEYRSGDNPDLSDYRARQRFGRHKGDQAVQQGGLGHLIFMALLAVAALVIVRNMPLFHMLMHLKP